MADIIERNADYIRSKITEIPKTAIVLGSGLGDMGEKIENPVYIDYGELEGFAVSTAPGHKQVYRRQAFGKNRYLYAGQGFTAMRVGSLIKSYCR